jgi:predicted dehydrogenase
MARPRIAVVGVGHLGKEHARILSTMPQVELVGVVDIHFEQARAVADRCGTRAYDRLEPLWGQLDAAVVAVPTSRHYEVAEELLRRGVHLLVEKPLAGNLDQADALVNLAHRTQRILQVGHVERFNPAFEELCRRPLRPKFIECQRLGPFSGRSTDIGVVLDLMIHDLDLVCALVPVPLRTVSAVGVSVFGGHEDVANARLEFEDGSVATLTASRASTRPFRKMRVWGAEGYASIDFAARKLTLVQPSEELRRKGLDPGCLPPAALATLRDDWFSRYFHTLELDCNRGDQLTRELEEFLACIVRGVRPRVSGENGRNAVALGERILGMLRTHAWEGTPEGPTGPRDLPLPAGLLFDPPAQSAAA